MVKLKQDLFDQFKCIASDCSFTCCKEWDIAVDKNTSKKWEDIIYEKTGCKLRAYTERYGDSRRIVLDENMNCPFLREDALCQLVVDCGDEVLSKTCAEFPRQIHEFSNRIEYSVVSCCPEVVDYFERVNQIEFNQSDTISFGDSEEEQEEKVCFEIRQDMISFLQNHDGFLDEKCKMLFFMLLDIQEKYYADSEWVYETSQYYGEEVLEDLKDAVEDAVDATEMKELRKLQEKNELLLDITINYVEKGLYATLLNPLYDKALKVNELIDDDENRILERICKLHEEYERKLDSMEDFFQNFLISELFTNLVKPESNVQSMTVMMQWILLEYSVIRYALFLDTLDIDALMHETEHPKIKLRFEKIRDCIVLFSRIMGYGEDDIYEYMEECFEDLIWEWSYVNMLL